MANNRTTLGIMGGGQVAQLLTIRACELGYDVMVLAENSDDPAVQMAHMWLKGKPSRREDVVKLKKYCDHLLFESEVPNPKILELILGTTPELKRLIPLFIKLSDRWTQKELLWDYEIPQTEFMKITTKDDLDQAFQIFKNQMLIKNRIPTKNEHEMIPIRTRANLEHFKNQHKGFETSFLIEKKENFKSEFALILFRNQLGEVVHYPLFHVTPQDQNWIQVDTLKNHKGYKLLLKKIIHFLNDTKYIGPITFEIGQRHQDLVVFGVQPRITTAGMITQDGFTIDQFELYIRSISGVHLPPVHQIADYCLSRNLIGTKYSMPVAHHELDGKLYWYNKKKNRPGRKLGHINYFGDSKNQLLQAFKSDRRKINL